MDVDYCSYGVERNLNTVTLSKELVRTNNWNDVSLCKVVPYMYISLIGIETCRAIQRKQLLFFVFSDSSLEIYRKLE